MIFYLTSSTYMIFYTILGSSLLREIRNQSMSMSKNTTRALLSVFSWGIAFVILFTLVTIDYALQWNSWLSLPLRDFVPAWISVAIAIIGYLIFKVEDIFRSVQPQI